MRLALIQLALFVAPFGFYIFYLLLKRENPFTGERWSWVQVVILSFLGLVLSVFIFGFLFQHAGENISGRVATEQVKP